MHRLKASKLLVENYFASHNRKRDFVDPSTRKIKTHGFPLISSALSDTKLIIMCVLSLFRDGKGKSRLAVDSKLTYLHMSNTIESEHLTSKISIIAF